MFVRDVSNYGEKYLSITCFTDYALLFIRHQTGTAATHTHIRIVTGDGNNLVVYTEK